MLAVGLLLCASPAAAAEAPAPSAPAGGPSQLLSSIPGQPAEGQEGEEEGSAAGTAEGGEGGQGEPAAGAQAGLAPALSASAAEGAGHVKYRLDAASYFDRYAEDASWIQAHADMIKAYPTFGDVYVKYGRPVLGAHDPATEGFAPLGRPEIEAFVAKVKRDVGAGYAGVFVDDANWSFTPSPGPEAHLAELLVALRRAEPGAVIEMNSQYHDIWPKMKAGDPNVARALAQVNIVTKEFGVGPNAAITTPQDYAEFMTFADALLAKGIHIVMTGDRPTSVRSLEYNLGTCLLVNDGGDYLNEFRGRPGHLWRGYAANLGNALTARERLGSGLWTRRFSGGVVYTVEPGGPTQTVKLARKMHSAEWGTVDRVTLSAEEGAVLRG